MDYPLPQDKTLEFNKIRFKIVDNLNKVNFVSSLFFLRPDNIHVARKCLMEIYALIRLFRDYFGEEKYKEYKILFRDIDHELSPYGESDVLMPELEYALESCDVNLSEYNFYEIQTEVEKFNIKPDLNADMMSRRIEKVLLRLNEINHIVDHWPNISYKFASVEKSFYQSYEQAYEYYHLCLDDPTTSNLIEWHKRLTYLMYNYEFISEIWCRDIYKLKKDIFALYVLLGYNKDMELLKPLIEKPKLPNSLRNCVKPLISSINQNIQRSQDLIFAKAKHIFALEPGQHVAGLTLG